MKARIWGCRGSLAAPGPETVRYGGNTSCVEVRLADGTALVLDAGTGIRPLGLQLDAEAVTCVHLLLSHLHMDHLQGLGFFGPLYNPATEVHIWGPASVSFDLRARLTRYLSPPLFPVLLRDLPCSMVFHEVPGADFEIGPFQITSELVCHPGPTVGYRIESANARMAYMPDHEPALGARTFPIGEEWTSGYTVAQGVDLLIHDAQYSHDEYTAKVGWGHSSLRHALDFATLADVGQLVLFHHDPSHSDADLDRLVGEAVAATRPNFLVAAAVEGAAFELGQRVELSVGG